MTLRIAVIVAAATSALAFATPDPLRLVLVAQHPAPVLTTRSPGAEGNRFGFEGGRVVKVAGTYHLFTSEMVDDPIWVRMRLGHWTSPDREHWTRVATIRESSARVHRRGSACGPVVAAAGVGRRRRPLESVLRRVPLEARRRHGVHAELRGPHLARAIERPRRGGHRRTVRRRRRRDAAGPRVDAVGRPAGHRLVLPVARRQATGTRCTAARRASTCRSSTGSWGWPDRRRSPDPGRASPPHSPLPIESTFIENPIVTPAPRRLARCLRQQRS